MLHLLRELQQFEQFQLEVVDVDLDKNLQERYGTLVPVLEGGGEQLCHYYLDEVALRDYLSGQTSRVS